MVISIELCDYKPGIGLIWEVKSNLIGVNHLLSRSMAFLLGRYKFLCSNFFLAHLLRSQVALLANVQDHHCLSDLDTLLVLRADLHAQVVLLDQDSELRLVVIDVEASPVELYESVVSGH